MPAARASATPPATGAAGTMTGDRCIVRDTFPLPALAAMTPELHARLLLDCHDRARALPRERPHPLTDPYEAQRIQDGITALREARGERRCGYKIGFTNRTIWPLYDVHHPIFGPVWDSGVTQLDGTEARAAIDRFMQPRLEPEIVLGLGRAPASDRTEDLLAAIDWVAHGFEIVHSVYPDWKFSAAETQAAQALHGALFVGPRVPIARIADPARALSALTITIMRDGQPIATGHGSDVLDGPIQALAHLVRQLRALGRDLAPGDLISTGTLTDAQPLAPDQLWRTRIDGVPLPGLSFEVLANALASTGAPTGSDRGESPPTASPSTASPSTASPSTASASTASASAASASTASDSAASDSAASASAASASTASASTACPPADFPAAAYPLARHFPTSYRESRERLLAAAHRLSGRFDVLVDSRAITQRGPSGETLALDFVIFGARRPRHALLVSSGTHGVEGFTGAAIQHALLDEVMPTLRLPDDVAIVVQHANNPYGFAWLRRVNEHNVDLNRNFRDHFDPQQCSPDYERLYDALNPPDLDPAREHERQAALDAFIQAHGARHYQTVVSEGQYKFPRGLQFGGHAREPSTEHLIALIDEHLSGARSLLWMDVHTGLGAFAACELITGATTDSAVYRHANEVWGGQVRSANSGESLSAPLNGIMDVFFSRRLDPAMRLACVSPEYGAHPIARTLAAFRADNWLRHHGDPGDATGHAIKRELLEVFKPDSREWEHRVVAHGLGLIEQALVALPGVGGRGPASAGRHAR